MAEGARAAVPRDLSRRATRPIPLSSKLSETQLGLLLVLPMASLLALIILYPIAYSAYISFTSTNPLTGAARIIGAANYLAVLTDSSTWVSLGRTVYYVACVTIIASVLAVGMALLLNEHFIGRPVLLTVIVLPWALSTYAAAVVWRYIYSPQYGLPGAIAQHLGQTPLNFLAPQDVIPFLALVHAWQFAPLGTYFLLATLQLIPNDLYRLAKVDGLGALRRFMHVTFSYIRLPLAIYLVLLGGQAATVFDLIYFMTAGGPGGASRTLTYSVYEQTFQFQNLGYGAAMSWWLLLLVTLLTFGYFALVMLPYRRARHQGLTA